MPTYAEITSASGETASELHAALAQGTAVLSGDQTVSFIPYVRRVLPIDGYVFWMNAALLSAQQLSQNGLRSAAPIVVSGSLHYASVGQQAEDESIVVRQVVFTAQSPVEALAEISSSVLYVAVWQTALGDFRFTFSSRNHFYEQAREFHYVGDAVYPVFEAQLIDTMAGFDQRQIVSNSLPFWLAMVESVPFPLAALVTTNIPLFPSYLVPNNLVPPYGAVYIPPQSSIALQPTPFLDRQGNQWQLMREHVRIVLYGLRNDDAQDFLQYIIGYSVLTDTYGLVNGPVIHDEHRTQAELVALAQRKVIDLDITYNQQRSRDIGRQLIKTAVADFAFNPNPIPPAPPRYPWLPG